MPPSSRPNAPPPAAIALQTPSALVRSSPSANVVVMIDSAAGETSAPPRPCSARAATSHVSEVARPLSSEANEKIATPQRNSLRRPNRSPARPPSSRKPPNTSVYALITHCRFAALKPRSAWIDGSATFTTVASSTTMNCARQTMTSTSQRLVSPDAGGSTNSSGALGSDAGHTDLRGERGAGERSGRSTYQSPIRPSMRTYVRASTGGSSSGPGPDRRRASTTARSRAGWACRGGRCGTGGCRRTCRDRGRSACGVGGRHHLSSSRPRTTRNCSASTSATATSPCSPVPSACG